MNLRDMLLPEFEQECANTRKVLERVPEDKFGWKPHDKSLSMVELAGHLAQIPVWGTYTIEKDEIDVADFPPPETPKSRGELLERFETNVTNMRKSLEGASNETLLGDWSLLMNGEKSLTMPRMTVLRAFVMNHTIHHRGQLTVYLRENDVPLPAIYGGSADEQM